MKLQALLTEKKTGLKIYTEPLAQDQLFQYGPETLINKQVLQSSSFTKHNIFFKNSLKTYKQQNDLLLYVVAEGNFDPE